MLAGRGWRMWATVWDRGTFSALGRPKRRDSPLADRIYHTLEEAALFMGEPVDRVRRRVDDKELPHVIINGRVMIPALPLRDFYYDHLLKAKRPKQSPKKGDASHAVAASNTQRASSGVSTNKDHPDENEWLPSAFHAGRLAGILPLKVHQLGLEGKVRTREQGNKIFYYRPDVEALKQRGDSPKTSSKSPDPDAASAESSRVPTEEHRISSSGVGRQGEDAHATARVTGLETDREFHGATIEEAVSAASKALGVREEEIGNFEVVDPGSKGFLGAGKRDVRIKLRVAERSGEERGVGPTRGEETNRPFGATELASVKEIIDLPVDKALDSAQAFLTRQGYRLVHRGDASLSANRFRPERISGGKAVTLLITALPQPDGGVRLIMEGDDSIGFAKWRDKWIEWAEGLPKKGSQERAVRAGKGEGLGSAEASEGNYYTPEQAAKLLRKDTYEINRMIHENRLPIVLVDGRRWIPATAVDDLLRRKYGTSRIATAVKPHKVRVPEGEGPQEEQRPPPDTAGTQEPGHPSAGAGTTPTPSTPDPEEPETIGEEGSQQGDSVLGFELRDLVRTVRHIARGRVEDQGGRDEADSPQEPDASARRVGELEDKVRALEVTLRVDREQLERELEREHEGREQDNLDARYEIDQLEAELDNLRGGWGDRSEGLPAQLENERALRVESEQWARELQSELDEERARRLALEESVGPSGSEFYEREEYEERLAVVNSELEGERKRRRSTEEWASGLQARLVESEAEKEALREALSSEKEKVRHLEVDKRLLDDVRRLLGPADAGGPSEPDKGAVTGTEVENDADGVSEQLVLNTTFGQVTFRPPFALAKQDEELLRLVASEGELTAEQIRKFTGRRRAAGELEDLLDRLADEGVRDLVKEVSEDCYRFNPAALHDH